MNIYRFSMYTACALVIGTALPGASCSPAEADPLTICGNGVTEGNEECDNGLAMNSDTVPNSCRTDCRWYYCGDGVTDVGEECDDGNNTSGDGCSDLCVHQLLCGDGLVEGVEQCDDGNTTSGDGCSSGCILEWVCGDGVCETDRQENCPACPEDCCPCGDGICDDAMGETCTLCHDDCCPDCGDGVLDPTEQCDDGNNADNDGCSAGCLDEDGTPTCGNGIWEAGEQCEDGNTTPGDGCDDACQVEYVCGDGLCEDSFGETCQICPPDCCPSCGNGTLEPTEGEECDGSDFGGLTCESACYTGGTPSCTSYCALDMSTCIGTLPICGNDTIECGESCDGSDLGGNTCNTFGLDGGTLACDGTCDYDLSGCGALLWYFWEDFEDPSTHGTWSFGTGEWEIGTIGAGDGPPSAYSGSYAMATNLGGSYANYDTYDVDRAVTPPINLTVATAPALRFFMYLDTELCCDGFAVFITTDAGASWSHLPNPTPAYNTTHGSYQCWQETSAFPSAWTQVDFDLTAYAGQTIELGFSFYSDLSVTYTGPHVDDILVAEPGAMP